MDDGTKKGNGKICIKRSEVTMVKPRARERHDDDKFYYLSNLDQNVASIIQTLYCFTPSPDTTTKAVAQVIREALAKVLLHFDPFCGILTTGPNSKLWVKCTNRGVPFMEAATDSTIAALGDISLTNPDLLGEFVYMIPEANNILDMPLLTVQVTRFSCGGFVLGLAVNHCMVDGISAMEFVNSWGETARGVPLSKPPFIDRSILRPTLTRPPSLVINQHQEFVEIEDTSDMANLYEQDGNRLQYKSFHFDAERMARLKIMAMEDEVIGRCSTFTVLTAFVWRTRSAALRMKPHQQTKLLFAVDARSNLHPPLPKGYFGNGIVLACCLCSARELEEKSLSFAVGLVQEAIRRVKTDEFVRSAISYIEGTDAKPSLTATLLITSWTTLAFGDADFGWGGPAQFGCVTPPQKEVALFYPTVAHNIKCTTLLLGLPTTAMDTFQHLLSSHACLDE